MKQNYKSAVKFYYDSNNFRQLDLAYAEIEKFLTCYYNFKFYFELDIWNVKISNEILENLSDENK